MKHDYVDTSITNGEGLAVFRCKQCAKRTVYPNNEECINTSSTKRLNKLYEAGATKGTYNYYLYPKNEIKN